MDIFLGMMSIVKDMNSIDK